MHIYALYNYYNVWMSWQTVISSEPLVANPLAIETWPRIEVSLLSLNGTWGFLKARAFTTFPQPQRCQINDHNSSMTTTAAPYQRNPKNILSVKHIYIYITYMYQTCCGGQLLELSFFCSGFVKWPSAKRLLLIEVVSLKPSRRPDS